MPEKIREESVRMNVRKILGLEEIPDEDYRTEIERVGWDNIFLYEAWLWSQRSHDPQTKCGCILVRENTVLSTGYNGFINDIDDKVLPNLRPSSIYQDISKYDFMVHAEHNAILNCAKCGVSTSGSTAYVTGEPCNWCLQYMWRAGISSIIYSDFNNPAMVQTEKHKKIQRALLSLMNPDGLWVRISLQYIPSNTFLEKIPTLSRQNLTSET